MLDGGLQWTIALIGGVGGTLTILCYGYWIKEEGRTRPDDLRTCRIDLACGYVMTALFGVSMVIIGSQIASVQGGGATLLVDLARGLEATLGSYGWAAKWAFLIGAWGAVFSSLLGVWQSLPYLFTDFWNLAAKSRENSKPNTQSFAYRGYLYGLATIPATGLWVLSFESAQKTYAVVGALVVPILAGVLLYLNNRSDFVGQRFCNRWQTNLILLLCLLFFLWAGWLGVRAKLGW